MTKKQRIHLHCEPRPGTGCEPRTAGGLSSYSAVVADYIRTIRPNADEEQRHFSAMSTLSSAVERATLCKRHDGKRHPHQYRIPAASLREAHRRLTTARLESCRCFDELHDTIAHHIDDIHMIGELTIYDIAHRIGSHLGLAPSRVYLHAGTRAGARALGMDGRRKFLEMAELPAAFRSLSAAECEDCLCIYKDELRAIAEHG